MVYKPTVSEMLSFCRGMYNMYEFGSMTKPDVAIFPLRGAYPFSASYKKIANIKQEPIPDFLLLPIGTFNDLTLEKERGLATSEKAGIVMGILGSISMATHRLERSFLLMR